MQQQNHNFKNFSNVVFNNNLEIEGLDCFIKNLEKHFFCQATVRNCSPTTNSVNLVVELNCNFELLEALHYFEKDAWGSFKCEENSFDNALNTLKECNTIHIYVEEFSLFFKDTSIIVNKIYDESIPEQLGNIFVKLNEHSINFTKGLTEIPSEIYMPVFEDTMTESEHMLLMDIQSDNNYQQDYFSFWGLYYCSEDDAVVYDLNQQSIIKGDLQMLNR